MLININGKEIEFNKITIGIVLVILILCLAVFGIYFNQKGGGIILDKSSSEQPGNLQVTGGPEATVAIVNNSSSGSEDEIKVYIVGCVKKEGVVTLKKGQIIEDAIKAAGGATKGADLRNINLAYELSDNEMIRIYSKKSKKGKSEIKTPSKDIGYVIKNNSGGASVKEENSGEASKQKININTATASELDQLPGVGPATAAKIIYYRENTGKFNTIEDIKNVSGIGDSKFSSMKDNITVK